MSYDRDKYQKLRSLDVPYKLALALANDDSPVGGQPLVAPDKVVEDYLEYVYDPANPNPDGSTISVGTSTYDADRWDNDGFEYYSKSPQHLAMVSLGFYITNPQTPGVVSSDMSFQGGIPELPFFFMPVLNTTVSVTAAHVTDGNFDFRTNVMMPIYPGLRLLPSLSGLDAIGGVTTTWFDIYKVS